MMRPRRLTLGLGLPAVARLVALAQFLVLAICAAALFGVVHDQISYTVSHEYFTRFKFLQFGLLNPEIPERVRVAIVGIQASWWMGVPLGVMCGLAGFVQRTARDMRLALLCSLPTILGFALVFALCGLVYGYFQTRVVDLQNYPGWFIPRGLKDPRRFLCAGYMHDSAYIGGALAIPVAWLFQVVYRWRARAAP